MIEFVVWTALLLCIAYVGKAVSTRMDEYLGVTFVYDESGYAVDTIPYISKEDMVIIKEIENSLKNC